MDKERCTEGDVEGKVQECVDKAVSALASQLGKKIDDCMDRLEGKFAKRAVLVSGGGTDNKWPSKKGFTEKEACVQGYRGQGKRGFLPERQGKGCF